MCGSVPGHSSRTLLQNNLVGDLLAPCWWSPCVAGLATQSTPSLGHCHLCNWGRNFLWKHGFPSMIMQVIPTLSIALIVSLMPDQKTPKSQRQLNLFCAPSQSEEQQCNEGSAERCSSVGLSWQQEGTTPACLSRLLTKLCEDSNSWLFHAVLYKLPNQSFFLPFLSWSSVFYNLQKDMVRGA